MSDYLRRSEEILASLPMQEMEAHGLTLNRLQDNPEAARYFLAYADWKPVEPADIFADLVESSAQRTQVYVDFPFCPVVCNFCAFYPVIANGSQMEVYVSSLKKEIRLLRDIYFRDGREADSLELGGGTPTQLPLALLQDAVGTLLDQFPFRAQGERNFETTPDCVIGDEGIAKLSWFQQAGFNRVSIGVQSFDDAVLRAAHRSHSSGQIIEAYENARTHGFDRINFDILFGLLDQTLESFLHSIDRSIELGVDIIEIYSIRFFDTKLPVPLTKLYLQQPQRFIRPEELLLGRIAADLRLREAGYEASNGRTYFRRRSGDDYYADFYRQNFQGANVLGVGRKSHSNAYPWQYANYRNLDKYAAALDENRLPIAAGCRLNTSGLFAKYMTGALQLADPFDFATIRSRFGEPEESMFDELMQTFVRVGLLETCPGGFQKTRAGFLFIEEMVKAVFDRAVSPFNVHTDFLGRHQTRPATRAVTA